MEHLIGEETGDDLSVEYFEEREIGGELSMEHLG